MTKNYIVINDGVISNVIVLDIDANPNYVIEGDIMEHPTITKTYKDLDGNDVEYPWSPGIGTKYIDGEFRK
jgi:hypothetical protein